jgi:hypothetical protein
MSFDQATLTIAEIGAHGDYMLRGEEFDRDDRAKRIDQAADLISDWVFESICQRYDGMFNLGDFKQEQLPVIARLVAVGMAAQFDFELERECQRNEAF